MSEINPSRVLIKAVSLFVLLNILYALFFPRGFVISGYNNLFPGRTRFPFGARNDPYSLSVDQIDAMFASHIISALKEPGEYRVVVIGDSSIWGEGLKANEIISEQWNQINMRCREKTVRVYDLGYPHPSVVKDLVILDKALEYEPDFIVWFVTLNTVISERVNPFLDANREAAVNVLTRYNISFRREEQLGDGRLNFYEKTLIGQRSNLTRQMKLQMLGVIWTATGADTKNLPRKNLPNFNVDEDPRYRGMDSSGDIRDMLMFDALAGGVNMAGPIPILIVNEPIFIAKEKYAAVRYNAAYPRWAYDQYRAAIAEQAQNSRWNYLDLWDALPFEYFSDPGLHRTVAGERLLIQHIVPELETQACSKKP